jgi:hypothetical protein
MGSRKNSEGDECRRTVEDRDGERKRDPTDW